MKQILQKLLDYQYLSNNEAKKLLISIVKEEVPETQVAAIITVFLMRSVSVEEILGFRQALLEMCVPLDFSNYKPLDIVGTGGDGKNTFNISTLSCFVVAGAGYPVVKHGNYGATSVSGASNAMEHHGIKFTTNKDILQKSIENCNIAYLHAPLFSPALKAVAPTRKSLGVRTFFNILGPLINPAKPYYQMLGVYNLSLARLYSYIYQQSKRQFSIVHSLDGYDEISLTSQFKVVTNDGEKLFVPQDIGMPKLTQQQLFGGDTIEEAATIFSNVLNCNATEAQMNVVIANSAFAIHLIEAQKTIEECIEIARQSLYSKKALQTFKKFIEINS